MFKKYNILKNIFNISIGSLLLTSETHSENTSYKDFNMHLAADHRKHWWTEETVKNIAQRAEFIKANRVLDIGCGVGHWASVLRPHFKDNVEIIGIDYESRFIDEAIKRQHEFFSKDTNITFQVADVYKLPFPDNSFDVVTSQMVLIHLKNVKEALKEMIRVLKPGGFLVFAEPNKTTSLLNSNTALDTLTIDEKCGLVKLYLTCAEGKIKKGKGNDDLGPRVAEYLRGFNVKVVGVYASETQFFLEPPYSTKPQEAFVHFMKNLIQPGSLYTFTPEKKEKFATWGGRRI